ncbi:guanylate-binding protein 6-like [Ctenodactylus gundi]
MASGLKMSAPICLVENIDEKLSVKQEAIKILEEISQPVVVVAIVGLYRTGKSYLMNRLAGQNHGFSLGSTIQSETKGIWMWCLPHPTKPNTTLVLLDTEGLGDVEKGDPVNDSWIFALAVLLSSAFVYNSMKTINHQALEQLHYVTELTQLIRAKLPNSDGIEDSTEFVSFFPDFIWTVRDFTLELKVDGQPITEDEYLENALKLTKVQNPSAEKSNCSRECIKKFFPKRKCFVFDQPTNDKELLANIDAVSEDQLDPKFQEQTNVFCSYIFTHVKTKTLSEGIVISGSRLGTVVQTYVSAIKSGAVPCLENAVTALAQQENSAAVQQAAEHYSQQMAQRVRLPTDTLEELLDAHAACEKEAIAVFMERSFKDKNQEFQKKLMKTIVNMEEELLKKNEVESEQYCRRELDELSKPLADSISAGDFCVPGGHQLYMETRKKVEQEYWQVPRKGVKAREVFQKFLQAQAATEESILQSDNALTEGAKAMAAERAKKEEAEKEKEILTQKMREQQLWMEAQEKTFKENMEQLKQKHVVETENLLRKQIMIMEHLLTVQNDLLGQGFKEEAENMNAHINDLRKRVFDKETDNRSFFVRALHDPFGGVIEMQCQEIDVAMRKGHDCPWETGSCNIL